MNTFFHSLYAAAAMFWETFWALVLGFLLSGIFQVFISKARMTRAFGKVGLREVALATLFGAASSSCSYAAVATAKTAFKKGAALVPALAFMFASTNLVFELGLVLWLLMGWQFVLAEMVGAFVLIGIMWALVRLTMPKGLEAEARAHEEQGKPGSMEHDHSLPAEGDTWRERLRNRHNWSMVADAFVMDWQMLWKEITVGFLIAGVLMVAVPDRWWQALFLQHGPSPLRLVENAIVGPLIAVASFVCSVGNIPLASLLWAGGISFGGVISFIYADLIVLPIIAIYKKYYGLKAAAYITGVLFVSMVLAGIAVDLLFAALHLIPTGPRPASMAAMAHFQWNYTTWLDLAALLVLGLLFTLHKRNPHAMSCHGGHDAHEEVDAHASAHEGHCSNHQANLRIAKH